MVRSRPWPKVTEPAGRDGGGGERGAEMGLEASMFHCPLTGAEKGPGKLLGGEMGVNQACSPQLPPPNPPM